MVIEVTSDSRDKYEYSSQWEAFVLNRIIPSSVFFPVEYGFVPQTWSEDGDPLDIMALSYTSLTTGCIVKVRVIGALVIEDEERFDTKILSVLANDARFEGYHDIADVYKSRLVEVQEFFETYKRLEPPQMGKGAGMEGRHGSPRSSKAGYEATPGNGEDVACKQKIKLPSQTFMFYLIRIRAVLVQFCHKIYNFPEPSMNIAGQGAGFRSNALRHGSNPIQTAKD